MISLETSLAMLSVSGPIMVAIVKMVPRKIVPQNGISEGEFRVFASFVRQNLSEMRQDIRELNRRSK